MEIVESYGIFARNENFVIRQDTIIKMADNVDDYRTKLTDIVSGWVQFILCSYHLISPFQSNQVCRRLQTIPNFT